MNVIKSHCFSLIVSDAEQWFVCVTKSFCSLFWLVMVNSGSACVIKSHCFSLFVNDVEQWL